MTHYRGETRSPQSQPERGRRILSAGRPTTPAGQLSFEWHVSMTLWYRQEHLRVELKGGNW